MSIAAQYRDNEYHNLQMIAGDPDDAREYQRLERSLRELADNAQWLAVNHDKTFTPARSAALQ